MFSSLLTPLKTAFEEVRSPRVSTVIQGTVEESPEDFAHDVRVEIIRRTVEDLKVAPNIAAQIEELHQIDTVLREDASMKQVFSELDGFLVLVSVLSTLREMDRSSAESLSTWREYMRVCFSVLCVALSSSPRNQTIFEKTVGWETLKQALHPASPSNVGLASLWGLLLSLAFNDMKLESFFVDAPDISNDQTAPLDSHIRHSHERLTSLKNPNAVIALFELHVEIMSPRQASYLVFRTIERIVSISHRNQAMLNALGLGGSVFDYVSKKVQLLPTESTKLVVQKLLRRLLEMGVPTLDQARALFQNVLRNSAVDSDALTLLRSASRAKWPSFFSFNHASALILPDTRGKAFPPLAGFTYMTWIYVDRYPLPDEPMIIFGARSSSPSRWIVKLSLLSEGDLECATPSMQEPLLTNAEIVRKGRWTHVTLVHYPSRSSSPNICLYVDGHEIQSESSVFPKPSPPPTTYHIGCDPSLLDFFPQSKWSMATSHLIGCPLSSDLVLLAHHLGPRYIGNFQDAALYRFLTYEASTSLNIHMFGNQSSFSSKSGITDGAKVISKALAGDVGFNEDDILLSLSPYGVKNDPDEDENSGVQVVTNASGVQRSNGVVASMLGDVYVAQLKCLDDSVRRMGGPAIALKIIQCCTTSSDLENGLGILFDVIRTSWQNSEDMERLRGYDVLSSLLRAKSSLINQACFEVIFESLGINFSNPRGATIVNTVAYRALGLDFHLWSLVNPDLQTVYWSHFEVLLEQSNFKRFNSKHRIARKFNSPGVLRQALFVYQTDLYPPEQIHRMVDAIAVLARSNWSTDTTIKPLISYLAARLHSPETGLSSPLSLRSHLSHIDRVHAHEKAEQLLVALVSILSTETFLAKLNASLPLSRILILLLGPNPSPVVTSQVLRITALQLRTFSNSSRKLELLNFWSVLKVILPESWDPLVHSAAFDLLLGRTESASNSQISTDAVVKYPQMLPPIFASLEHGLTKLLERSMLSGGLELPNATSAASETVTEAIIEEFVNMHTASRTFREAFSFKLVMTELVSLLQTLTSKGAFTLQERNSISGLLDRLIHFANLVCADDSLDFSHKQELESALQATHLPPTSLSPAPASTRRRSILGVSVSDRRSISERNAQKTLYKVATWRAVVISTEKQRRRKMYQDMREELRALQRLTQWLVLVHHERSLWPQNTTALWRLDEAEGPYRVRKKLEPEIDKLLENKATDSLTRELLEIDDANSVVVVQAPWDESYNFDVAEEDDKWEDELIDDKHRKIRHELEPGDVIEVVKNVARIVGVDSSPGLFILGRTHLYVRDGLVESADGEVVDARDAPKDVLQVPGTLLADLDPNIRARRWSFEALAGFSTRTHLFRDVSLEIYFRDSRSLLCVFPNKLDRQAVLSKLQKVMTKTAAESSAATATFRSPLLNLVSATGRIYQNRPEIDVAQRRWQAREISNFAYLSIINQASGRTPNDLTQYPVFPWILKDYTSNTLDLSKPETFRDLNWPMGALTEVRRASAEARYSSLTDIGEPPFHYGTHFSSSMITSHFLIRLPPFSKHFKVLQGGDFDLPERLFVDVQRAYESAAQDSRGDVRELIPEFFTCPEFLENFSDLELGVNAGGEQIQDVKLPPWAKRDALLFIALHRQALESEYVSRNLPTWIDLIWGCRQKDVASCNVYHPLSYEGAIDLDSIDDPLQLAASVGIIHNFGQTPRKIFSSPHPPRYMDGELSLPLGTAYGIAEHPHLLFQSNQPIKSTQNGVSSLYVDLLSEKVIPCGPDSLIVPNFAHESVEWGFQDQSLRLFADKKLVQIVESAYLSCACFCDSEVLIAGTSDNMVTVWRIHRSSSSSPKLKLSHLMRGHESAVQCVDASRPWSLIVTGSDDGTAIFWDLNRAQYVRTIRHDRPVHSCAINSITGDVATCSIDRLSIHTINGRHIASLRLGAHERITSLAFHERETSLVGILAAGSADGSISLRTWNPNDTPLEEKAKWKFSTVRNLKMRKEPGLGMWLPTVTALKFVGEILYSGDESGRMFNWTLPD
ncbi:beach-domain-containing protein [Cantharellus anzutake]|uniref:beach-domain-containing protein n=1 Tax=Cantharellus anzutake TaxID=1750568 RepID=UPI00190480F2|nr:beach-domain-containing protein [Cantharellus anzutake]KAF8327734.1 beach-domain-containing protein [Cantharellus anzutake]